MHIVITGNPLDGFTYHGPFLDSDLEAVQFLMEGEADWWWVVLAPGRELRP